MTLYNQAKWDFEKWQSWYILFTIQNTAKLNAQRVDWCGPWCIANKQCWIVSVLFIIVLMICPLRIAMHCYTEHTSTRDCHKSHFCLCKMSLCLNIMMLQLKSIRNCYHVKSNQYIGRTSWSMFFFEEKYFRWVNGPILSY